MSWLHCSPPPSSFIINAFLASNTASFLLARGARTHSWLPAVISGHVTDDDGGRTSRAVRQEWVARIWFQHRESMGPLDIIGECGDMHQAVLTRPTRKENQPEAGLVAAGTSSWISRQTAVVGGKAEGDGRWYHRGWAWRWLQLTVIQFCGQ